MPYYALLTDPPYDISVRLAARDLSAAIREVKFLNREAMVGTDRRDVGYYLGVNLDDATRDERDTALAQENCSYVGDVVDMDDVRWSIFAR